ncbi:MAG: hypothetical protein GEV08_11560 [Acidimicrobiia bacterium]|nr:hypothetical protein [Acidimicrobiia bacterium]
MLRPVRDDEEGGQPGVPAYPCRRRGTRRGSPAPRGSRARRPVTSLICLALGIYSLLILVRIVLSWFPISSGGLMASVYGVLFSATEPVLGAIRRVIPPVRMGAMGLDLSPLIVLFGLQILRGVIC